MQRLRFKTMDELGMEPLTWQSSKNKRPLHLFIKGAWVGVQEISVGPKGGVKKDTMMSTQYGEWCLEGVPADAAHAALGAVLDTLKGRPDLQRVVLHQMKAKLDYLCEVYPLPPDFLAVVERVDAPDPAQSPTQD